MYFRSGFQRKSYFIKEGYRCNYNPQYYLDNKCNFIYQQDAYNLAYYLAERSDVKYVIDIGGGNGEKLIKFKDRFEIIIVDFGDNLKEAERNLGTCKTISYNIEKGLPDLPLDIVQNSIILFCDVIEHIVEPDRVLRTLSRISHLCKFMIITTPDRVRARGIGDYGPPANTCHVREWCIDEFDNLLKNYNFSSFMVGYTTNTNFHLWKNNIIALSGMYCNLKSSRRVKTLAVINMYNEADIISEVIDKLLKQGIDVKVVDNWSNDGSYELVHEITLRNKNVTLERYPSENAEKYEWKKLLQHTEMIAKNSDYDWIIHHDADEIRMSPWKSLNLCEAISFVDSVGYNAIDFTVLDFRPCENQLDTYSIEQNLRFFEFGRRPGHFVQIKAWKNNKNVEIDLTSSGGHEIKFVNRKVYPLKFLLKHYPLRSTEQARKKIFEDRVPRFSNEERSIGWHIQYDNYDKDSEFLWDKNMLKNWNPNYFEMEYFVERISGIGVL